MCGIWILINNYILLEGLADVCLEDSSTWMVVWLEFPDRRPEVDLPKQY